MAKPIILYPHLTRLISHYKKFDIEVPKAILNQKSKRPDLSDFPYPLPQKKSDYTCYCEGENGVMWYGSKGGVTRYDKNAELLESKVMYFSAQRDLLDNNVHNLIPQGDGVWALTDNGVTHIDMVKISMEEKAEVLLKETQKYVSRHSMVSEMHLSEAGNLKSVLPYGCGYNDGCYTSFLAIGEILHYATLKREKGPLEPETIKAREYAQRLSEAALLLMYVSGRGDGFVARTYLAGNEPVKDDGLFFKKNGERAVCLNTAKAREMGVVGLEIKADAEIPERLKRIYENEGYSDTDITYMADTGSEDITLHYVHLLVAHEFLGYEDMQYDALLIDAVTNITNHIIKNNFTLRDADGKSTTSGRWDEKYFNSPEGWSKAPLNAGEILMYLKVAMRITGKKGDFKKAYDKLVKKGYSELTTRHYDRLCQRSALRELDDFENLIYGDQELSMVTFWALCSLEADEENKKLYKNAFKSWRSTMARECNPAYDFVYSFCNPEEAVLNEERVRLWFYRFSPSRLAGGVSLGQRNDVPVAELKGESLETGILLTPDESFLGKYSRNPYEYKKEDISGIYCVESCYPYSFAYWFGRYFKFIEEGEEND